MVLWVLVLIALIAASFAHISRTEVNLARNLVESGRAEALAEAGVYRAILGLSGETGRTWRADGTVYAWLYGGGEIRVAIEDEGGKIDLNNAGEGVLRALFTTLDLDILDIGDADALTDALLDFRDPDDLTRVNGAEDLDYAAAGLEHDAKDGPFELTEELQQVYGMRPEIYEQVAPALTVHSRLRRPFAPTAPPEALAALSASVGEPLQVPVQAADPQAAELVEVLPEDLTEEPQILSLGPTSAVSRVGVFTIHAEARSAGGAVYALEAITRLTRSAEQPFQFHGWRRAERSLFEDASESDDLDEEE